jgi:hypothetical protein
MTDRETMKLALDALENLGKHTSERECDEAIDALRAALAQQTVLDAVLVEREACAKVCDELAYFDAGDSAEAMRHCAQDIRARGKE